MARLYVTTATIDSGASHTAGVNLGQGEFTRFAVQFPDTSPLTSADAEINAQNSLDGGTSWSTIGYSNNPATSTSGVTAVTKWAAPRESWGNTILCEAALFATDFRLKFNTAATTASEVYVIMGKGD